MGVLKNTDKSATTFRYASSAATTQGAATK